MSKRPVITWTKAMREQFRKAYKAAVKTGQGQFVFDENEYLTHYAKYLLEYLDMKLK